MKMANKRYSKVKMFLLYVLSLLVNLLPLIIVLIINWGVCTKTQREGVAITVTGISWIVFLVASMIGAMPKKVNRVVTLVVAFVVLELMKPLLSCMCMFSGAAAIGALLDLCAVKPFIKKYQELRVATKTADMTTEQVKLAVKEILSEKETKETNCTGRV